MALRNVVKKGDEILRKRCREIDKVDDRIKEILQDMLDTMRAEEGVGIAAPQVGIMRRMFVMEPEEGRVYMFVNPKIIETSGEQLCDEACLSVPGYVGTVKRPQKIKIKGLDENGIEVIYEFEDFHADVACHEYDHLDGVLFIDKASDIREITPDEGDK